MKAMPKFKVGLRNRTIAERFSICGRIADALKRAPEEKRRYVNMSRLEEKRAEAEAAHKEVQKLQGRLKAAITDRKTKLKGYCDEIGHAGVGAALAATSAADVLACGLELEKPKYPVGLPAAPSHFRAVPWQENGAVKLRCKRPVRRCFLFLEMTTDPTAQTGWVSRLEDSSDAATRIVRGLQPGVLYWFRIRAHNTAGYGPWSEYLAVRPAS